MAETLEVVGRLNHALGAYSDAEKAFLRGIRVVEQSVGDRLALLRLLDGPAS